MARTNDTANQEAARLQSQAQLLLEQAQLVEWQADIRQKIRSSSFRFKPAVYQDYTSTKTLGPSIDYDFS